MTTTLARGGGGTVMPATAQRGPRPLAPDNKRCTREKCGGELRPDIDRNGQSVDSCAKCGTIHRPGIGATNGVSAGGGRPCSVKKCPGRLNSVGVCSCCEQRERFLEQHLPKRHCGICGGAIKTRGKFCGACAPINTKVNQAKAKAKT